jgi:hypothetical protein
LSFPPLFPHSENVARVPAWLPNVLPLGEHRSPDEPDVLRIDDLGIVAAADGLHLVSISRRRLIEPQVIHALALPKQAPPRARFLATLRRGFLTRFTEFDWGPRVSRLPYLPAVRYGRAILSTEMWSISPADDARCEPRPNRGQRRSAGGGDAGAARTPSSYTTIIARCVLPSRPTLTWPSCAKIWIGRARRR